MERHHTLLAGAGLGRVLPFSLLTSHAHPRRGATANAQAHRIHQAQLSVLLAAHACPPVLSCPSPAGRGHHHHSQMPTPASLATRSIRAAAQLASSALAAAVFAFLDVVDVLLCFAYAFLDGILEDGPVNCYCHRTFPEEDDYDDEEEQVSDTLYVRRSACRDALRALVRRLVRGRSGAAPEEEAPCKPRSPRWSDCGCASCGAWRQETGAEGRRLHVVVKEPLPASSSAGTQQAAAEDEEDAVFIHGFTSSSSFWTETVFRESSPELLGNRRLLAVDLLGFGQSPKPANCSYRLKDHVDAIERSILVDDEPTTVKSFHLVSHSMGCIVALALAARHPSRVKSVTLVAPPLFPAPCEAEQRTASQVALSRLAEKKLWPPLLFGSAVMSWYEHIGRTVCFVVCKNHMVWEWLYKLLTRKQDVDFRLRDLTSHTHHSAWHTMHNVLCGGARLQDRNLEAVKAAGVPVQLIHGVDDQMVPVECTRHLKAKFPCAVVRLMQDRDHSTVVLGREKDLVKDLRDFWFSFL